MLGFKKPPVHSVLLIDISSNSVGVGLSGIRNGSLPELAFTTRIPFAHRADFNLDHIERAMLFALRDALAVTFREGLHQLNKRGFPGHMNHCIISFSSPWFISKLGGSESSFVSSLLEKYSDDMEIFESERGLHGATEAKLLKRIEDEVLRTFGLKEGIGVQSFSVVFSKVLEHAFEDLDPALFVDISGHTTDVLSMNKGKYEGYHSAPIGTFKLKERELEWNTFWNNFFEHHPEEFSNSNVFLVADDYELSKPALELIIPHAHILPFDTDNEFIKEMIQKHSHQAQNERLIILATFTNLFH
jgi:hypothetical protein